MKNIWILVLGLFLIVSCTTNKDLSNNGSCTHTGVVKDMAGLDGCNYMIVLPNGKKLQAVEGIPDGVEFKDGMNIKFSYTVENGMAGICMAGDMVKLTCFEVVGD